MYVYPFSMFTSLDLWLCICRWCAVSKNPKCVRVCLCVCVCVCLPAYVGTSAFPWLCFSFCTQPTLLDFVLDFLDLLTGMMGERGERGGEREREGERGEGGVGWRHAYYTACNHFTITIRSVDQQRNSLRKTLTSRSDRIRWG